MSMMDHRDRSLALKAIGACLLLIGAVAAFLGPVEIYCFSLFAEGGRFHYEGFGFGSFMFGNIACQVAGYYLVAMLLIPLGYGHWKTRRWARTLSLILLWSWLVVGIPLSIVLFLMLVTAKELSLVAVLVAAILLGLSYLVIPGLLVRFYRSRDVRLTFESGDPQSYWIETHPMPVLVLSTLHLFYILVLHIPLLFNGIFPLFGVLVSDLPGMFLLDASVLCLALLVWGLLRLRTWAWWGSLIYFGLFTTSSILTLTRSRYADILSAMDLPPTEVKFLDGVPLQGFHFAVFTGIPLLITLGVILVSRKHFGSSSRELSH
jgi:hypothetical protein